MINKFFLSSKKNYFILSLLFILPLIFYWPFTLHFFSLKNDALTYYYPIRTLISDALHNGELPLWTPFINLGYPMHADMQSGAWNPVIWIFAFLSDYSLAAFHYELIFYIAFAGIGLYYLCKSLGCSSIVSFCIAVSYQFCGFMTDSPQFFNCISAACYLPFVFLFFRNLINTGFSKYAIYFSIALFLFFTGGYPSIFIITLYVLLFYFLFCFFKSTQKYEWVKLLAKPIVLSVLVFFLLSLPAILSFVPHLNQIARGKSQSLSLVLENSMNPSTLLSFISPFATTANNDFLESSILMRSVYIGLLPFVFLIFSLFTKQMYRDKENIFFLSTAMITLGMAFGDFFILRQIAYYVLPLMDSFRHPATFRLFSIFFFLLFTARGIELWLSTETEVTNSINIITKILISVSVGIAILSLLYWQDVDFVYQTKNAPTQLLASLEFNHRFIIQLPFILLVLFIILWAIQKPSNRRFLPYILLFDLFFATQLNMPVTLFGSKKMDQINTTLNRNLERFPIPENQSIEELSRNSFDSLSVSGSKIPYTKKWGRNDYFITPGNLTIQDSFYYSKIKDIIFLNPPVYFADSIVSSSSPLPALKGGFAFSNNPILLQLVNKNNRLEKPTIIYLSANKLIVETSNQDEKLMVVQQNNYPGWQAFIDKDETAFETVNTCMVGIKVPAGQHKITLIYKPTKVIVAFYISIACLIITMVILIISFFEKNKRGKLQKEV